MTLAAAIQARVDKVPVTIATVSTSPVREYGAVLHHGLVQFVTRCTRTGADGGGWTAWYGTAALPLSVVTSEDWTPHLELP